MQREDITDPDDEFRGLAPKSLSKSCDKDGSCEPEENAWAYLPDVEVRVSRRVRVPCCEDRGVVVLF